MYGEIFEGGEFTNAKAGINDCKFVSFGYNPNGGSGGSAKDVIDFIVKVGGLDIKTRWFEVDVNQVNTREIKDPFTGEKRQQTKEEAAVAQVKEMQWMTKAILTSLGVPTTAFKEGMSKVKSFKDYAQMLGSLVPKDAVDKDYEVILQYDNKGYLKMPNKLWVTGKVFRDKSSSEELKVNTDRLTMTKPGEEGEETPTETSSWTA